MTSEIVPLPRAGLVARHDMVSQYDGPKVAMLFVQRVQNLVEEGKRKLDEEVAAAKEQKTPEPIHQVPYSRFHLRLSAFDTLGD